MPINRIFVYVGIALVEIFLIYFYFVIYEGYLLSLYKKSHREMVIKRLDYCISKRYLKPMFMCIRDYIDLGGKEKELIIRREGIEQVLKENFLTADAYFLSKALIDDQNRPIYLRNAKLSQDVYIKNIANVYYYCLVSKKMSEALGASYENWKKDKSYAWIIEIIEKPLISIGKNYIIGKLKEMIKVSQDGLTTSVALGLLVVLDYKDESFYINFLGSNVPSVFITSTVGLYITGKESNLREHQKYYYFVLNRTDLYRYYSILLILRYTTIGPQVYRSILNFETVNDYKEYTFALIYLIN
ncbi:MAG: hypothetical protein ACK4GJ_05110 [bacterium]